MSRSGSGTTIIAGEMTGRRVLAIELSPAYVDVAVLRWQNFIGAAAVHEKTGRTFAEVAASRKVAAKLSLPSDETPAKVAAQTMDVGSGPKTQERSFSVPSRRFIARE
jgi:hypothetical protein